jgi:integrase/recombinase XerC
LKTAYAFGLRRNEIRMLDVADFGRNPDGPEFGEYGVVYVRHGKAQKGSPPKRRSVLAIWDWSAEVLAEWAEDIRPLFARAGSPACWPSALCDIFDCSPAELIATKAENTAPASPPAATRTWST